MGKMSYFLAPLLNISVRGVKGRWLFHIYRWINFLLKISLCVCMCVFLCVYVCVSERAAKMMMVARRANRDINSLSIICLLLKMNFHLSAIEQFDCLF